MKTDKQARNYIKQKLQFFFDKNDEIIIEHEADDCLLSLERIDAADPSSIQPLEKIHHVRSNWQSHLDARERERAEKSRQIISKAEEFDDRVTDAAWEEYKKAKAAGPKAFDAYRTEKEREFNAKRLSAKND